jgi:N-acetylneuraminate lyase
MNLRIRGLVAAPFTPFKPDESLNLGMIPTLAELLVRQKVTGAFVCGTTGEGSSLTTGERKEVSAEWVKAAAGRLKIIVHVGHNSTAESVQLARHAAAIGADAFASTAPSFFRPTSIEALVETCRVIAAGAPELPFYYYHIPVLTGIDLPMAELLPRAIERIPNFAGIKFTHENLMDYARAHALAAGRCQVMFGRDEILLAGLSFGAVAAVGSTYNFAAGVYLRLIEAFERGDFAAAREHQKRSIDFIAAFAPFGGLVAQKSIMRMLGHDCGPVRAPLQNLPTKQFDALHAALDRAGFFSYAASATSLESNGARVHSPAAAPAA